MILPRKLPAAVKPGDLPIEPFELAGGGKGNSRSGAGVGRGRRPALPALALFVLATGLSSGQAPADIPTAGPATAGATAGTAWWVAARSANQRIERDRCTDDVVITREDGLAVQISAARGAGLPGCTHPGARVGAPANTNQRVTWGADAIKAIGITVIGALSRTGAGAVALEAVAPTGAGGIAGVTSHALALLAVLIRGTCPGLARTPAAIARSARDPSAVWRAASGWLLLLAPLALLRFGLGDEGEAERTAQGGPQQRAAWQSHGQTADDGVEVIRVHTRYPPRWRARTGEE